MDPGNWATVARRRRAVRLHAALRRAPLEPHGDHPAGALRAARRRHRPRPRAGLPRRLSEAAVAYPLWFLAEIAIVATDLAEVIGTAIGLNLLFGIPLSIGVVITAVDVFLILYLQTKGFRWIEAFVITLLGVIAVCFLAQIVLARPEWAGVVAGFFPSPEIVTNPEMLYIALGIIGATVMPHNLYLHSAIVQTRAYGTDDSGEARGDPLRDDRLDRGADASRSSSTRRS